MNDDFDQNRDLESYRQPQIKHNGIYSTALIIGIGIAVYIYVFNFDSFSESELVGLTALWVFPIAFGYYGFMAQWLQDKLKDSEHENVAKLMSYEIHRLPSFFIRPIFGFLHLPLLIVNNNKPMVSALVGSVMWVILLVGFFVVIFPSL